MGLGHPGASDPLGLARLGKFPSNPEPRGPVYYESNDGPREAETNFPKVVQGQFHQRASYPDYPIPWLNGQTTPRGFLPKHVALNQPDHDSRHLGTPPRRQVVNHFEPENYFAPLTHVAESPFQFDHHNRHTRIQYEPRSFGYFARGFVKPVPRDDAVWGGFLQPQSRS